MIGLQRIEVEGNRYVLLPESEYERLCREASEAAEETPDLPPLPEPDKYGRYPALAYARISMARDLIRARKSVGLSQQSLADLAGIRQETVSRLESGKHTASTQTVNKILRVIEAQRHNAKRSSKRK